MKRIFKLIKNAIKRRGTRVIVLALLNDVKYEKSSHIGPLVKMERASIGKCSLINTLSAAYDCEIGNYCSIARECYIGAATHPLDWVSTSACFYLKSNFTGVCYHEEEFEWNKHTKIGNDVWLGFRTIVLGGVTIGDGAVVGAGSIVTKDIGPYEIWAGCPAKFIRKRFNDETIENILQTKWWNWDESEISKYADCFNNPIEFVKRNQ